VDREAVKLLALGESTEPNSETARPISVNGVTRQRAEMNSPEQWIEGREEIEDV
jgi:hypothetical protein